MTEDWVETTPEYDLDGSNYAASDLSGGGTVDKEGWYHFEVADVVPDLGLLTDRGKEKSPSIRFDLLVLQSVDGQSPAGSRLYHRIYLAAKGGSPPAEGSVKSALRFGLGLGLLASSEIDGRERIVVKGTNSTKIPSSLWTQAKGMQIVAKVKLEKGDERNPDKYAIPFGSCYQVDDEAVKDVQKNVEALAAIGKVVGQKKAAAEKKPATNGATAKPAAKPAPAAAVTDDDLADL